MDVRAATPDDARAVAELLHAFNEEFEDPTPGVDVLAERLMSYLAVEEVVALVAGAPEPVALALLFFRPNAWEAGGAVTLDELYVRPELRGQGIGSALLERAFAVARERGAGWFELDTGESDVAARRFYERHGLSNTDDGGDPMLYYARRLP